MHKNIGPSLKSATSLLHVEKELVKLFKTTKKHAGGGALPESVMWQGYLHQMGRNILKLIEND